MIFRANVITTSHKPNTEGVGTLFRSGTDVGKIFRGDTKKNIYQNKHHTKVQFENPNPTSLTTELDMKGLILPSGLCNICTVYFHSFLMFLFFDFVSILCHILYV